MTAILTVHGAARTVTGSCYLIETYERKFLVDCGMFQGAKTLKALNYGPFPFDPRDIDFVLLTHAHIDHSGLLPKLAKQGFDGPIYATRGTIDLAGCMLPDSGHIQEVEVEELNRRNARRGRERVTPIYTAEDAEACLKLFRPVKYDDWMRPAEGIRARFWNAGHILGSASIEIELDTDVPSARQLRLLFSGDIGPDAQTFHPAPDSPENIDYLICESTYGGRVRPKLTHDGRLDLLATEVLDAFKDKGALVIPAFAVERTQELLADLIELVDTGRIPRVPIFLDSPLAIRATQVFLDHTDELENGGEFAKAMATPLLRTTETAAESMGIERIEGNHIIVAASGMCDAGRIRHHLKNHLWRQNSTVLLVGFQAKGTLGRILADGAKAVRIQGEEVKVRAKVRQIDIYSGHADGEALALWIEARTPVKRAVFLVHGEEEGMTALHERLTASGLYGTRVLEPTLDDIYDLVAEAPEPRSRPGPRRLQPENVGRFDWHNDLSRLWLDIGDELDHAADDKARGIILRRLRRALEKSE
ncbi:MBL fold metallo-hydrolase [Parvibaculum sp.]|uniref:MBL fold metallo-hydrolase n=1 Tax=Parvibaculum sp. TaxID=2024848 RepID=UPI002CF40E6A|nr:MBL fold metallo-hydrolase [Parvibaculum sp.]HUD50077.1 MBL fold metallo-hydrolase [Parvibaculum sp.]